MTRTFTFSKATGNLAQFFFNFTANKTLSAFKLPGANTAAGGASIRDSVGNTAVLSLPAPS